MSKNANASKAHVSANTLLWFNTAVTLVIFKFAIDIEHRLTKLEATAKLPTHAEQIIKARPLHPALFPCMLSPCGVMLLHTVPVAPQSSRLQYVTLPSQVIPLPPVRAGGFFVESA